MGYRATYLVLLSIIALLIGFAYSYFIPTTVGMEGVPFSAMTAGFFICGTIFFGYASFIPMLLFGLQTGAERNAAIFLYIIPSILATYAGTKLGVLLQDDFNKKQNFFEQGKKILLFIVIAVLIAIIVEQALPYIMEFWPKDFLGLNLNRGTTVSNIIEQLNTRLRRY